MARPLARQLQQQCVAIRTLSTSAASRTPEAATSSSTSSNNPLDQNPDTVLPEYEDQLIRAGKMPIGSRRRRVAMRSTSNIAFEQLPYQAFQEARKVLAGDREEKLASIQATLEKIAQLQKSDSTNMKGGETMKQTKIASLNRQLENLKILADINDPLVKKRFEDGLGESLPAVWLNPLLKYVLTI